MKTPDEEIRAARDVELLLGNPVFKQAFESIESGLIDKMRQVAMHDINTQHELILTLQLLYRLKGQFAETVQSGKMAEIQKEQAQKVARLVRK